MFIVILMKLRPGRSVRTINSQAWSRFSIKKPRKNYVKSLPHTSLLVFNMGVEKPSYDLCMTLNSKQKIRVRSNALEAARQVANKYLEREIPNNYKLKVLTYPHNVIREKKRATGAGADRISQGMSLSFGSPSSVAAVLNEGQPVFELRTMGTSKEIARHALKRAAAKLSGVYSINTKPVAR